MYFWIHLALAVALTAYFLWRFLKDRLTYQILFVIWVPATLLTYVPFIGGNRVMRMILVAFQLVMFLLVIFFMFRKEPKKDADGSLEEPVKADTSLELSEPGNSGEPVLSDRSDVAKNPPAEEVPQDEKKDAGDSV